MLMLKSLSGGVSTGSRAVETLLLGRVPLLARQEALEVLGATLLVGIRPGLQKGFTNLRHAPALSRKATPQR